MIVITVIIIVVVIIKTVKTTMIIIIIINFNNKSKILHSQFPRTLNINSRTLSHLWLAITFGPLKPVANKRSHILTL